MADISIARNYQNEVTALSIYGRQGRFDDLEQSMQKGDASIKLRKSETDRSPRLEAFIRHGLTESSGPPHPFTEERLTAMCRGLTAEEYQVEADPRVE